MIEKSPEIVIIKDFVKELHPKNILEVGCNWGRELKHLEGLSNLCGIDKDSEKIARAKTYVKGDFRVCDAINITYKNLKFDMVFSTGVFAHSPPEKIKQIMDEMFRVSSKYILIVEYIGSHLSRNTVGNCKQNTWVHDYNKLVSGYDVVTKYNEKIFYGTDQFHVLLLKKDVPKIETIVKIREVPQEKRFEIKIGKFKIGF